MYSTNGRVKQAKETASSNETKKCVLVCASCGHKQPDAIKVFGEKSKCIKCCSEEVTFEYN